MSYQEKRSIVSLVSTIVISIVYFVWVYQRYQAGDWASDNLFAFWGAVVLIYVPVQVVLKVILHVVFSVINTVATHEEEPSITDEFDRLVELKAVRNFCYVFSAGFFLAMATLALNQAPSVMFVVLLATLTTAGAVLDASQLYFYQRGV